MMRSTPPILVTGAAGFIGYHVARRLLERGETVLGLDNLNDYYDVRLKKARLAQLKPFKNFQFQMETKEGSHHPIWQSDLSICLSSLQVK